MKRISIILLIFFTCACELIVDVDVPFEGEQLVVNAFMYPDSLWSASISHNRFILTPDSVPNKIIVNAAVTIHDEHGLVATLQYDGNEKKYRSQTEKPQAGKQYTLHVSAANYQDVEARSIIPNPATIASVEIERTVVDGNPAEVTKVSFKDNGDTKDFYHIRLEVIEENFDYNTGEITSQVYPFPEVSSHNPQLNSQFISIDAGLLMKDVLFNGKQTEVGIKLANGYYPSYFAGMRVVVRSVSEDYYNYMATKKLQDETSGDPFAQPVNVYNNISRGFGIFAGISSSAFEYYNPQPIITEISPASGKAGDVIAITGQNFSDYVIVRFKGIGDYPWAQVMESTGTQLKVVVPVGAVSGKLVVFRGASVMKSDIEFQVTN